MTINHILNLYNLSMIHQSIPFIASNFWKYFLNYVIIIIM